jgi:hypothetical protein
LDVRRQKERFFPFDEYLHEFKLLHTAGPLPLQGEALPLRL